MIREAIIKLSRKENLTYAEAEAVMDEIMSGQTTPVQTSAYLTALSLKGETIDEITASAAGMRAHCVKLLHDMDVLEALGVTITLPPEKSEALLREENFCFLFAQNYHIAMKYVAPVRKELGIRTVFNILGPLSNPAGANMELMGVYDRTLVEPLAQVMSKLGVKRGMVVYGTDRLDELSMSAPTLVCEIRDGWFQSFEITPEQFGYARCDKSELVGGTPAENAAITRAILSGEERGAKRQAVCLNAGAALYIGGKAATMAEGVRMAEGILDSGAALAKLVTVIRRTGRDRHGCNDPGHHRRIRPGASGGGHSIHPPGGHGGHGPARPARPRRSL